MPRELWFTAPYTVELRDAPPTELASGHVRLRGLVSGVSQGTELLLYRGEGPTPFDPSLDAPDAPTFPRRYGYAWVGEVVEAPAGSLTRGTRVFGLLPHGDEHCVPAPRVRALPNEVPAERAVLAANLETALNVIWDAGIALGDDVLVIGGGAVGLLAGHLAKRSGARRVSLSEPSAVRRSVALSLGFDDAHAPDDLTSERRDVVIEASGDPRCLDAAILHTRDEGAIVVASFYGQRSAPLSLGQDFHRRRLSLRSSQVSRIPPARSARWSYDRRFAEVTELLKNAALDALLRPAAPLADAARVYAELARTPGDALQTTLHYRMP